MISLKIHNKEEKWMEGYDSLAAQNKEALFLAQKGEEEYGDSQGWLDTEEWADEKRIRYLETLAADIRQTRMYLF